MQRMGVPMRPGERPSFPLDLEAFRIYVEAKLRVVAGDASGWFLTWVFVL